MEHLKQARSEAVTRAALPEILFAADVAVALELEIDEAEAAIRAGECGPHFEFRNRPAVLRETFLEHFEAQQRRPSGPGVVRILPRDGRGDQMEE
jgi:hypothetical protein